MAKRAAIYYRVSTTDQDVDGQVDELREYANHRGFEVVGEYIDKASGTARQRPELDQMLEQVRTGKVDLVLVWAFDRFARSTSHLVNTLEEFQQLGVDFISFRQQIDTSTAAGKLTFTILAGIAEFEREMIRERVKTGMAAAKARGKHVGRKQIPLTKQSKVRALRSGGLSYRDIAKQLGIAPGTAMRYAKSSRNH